MGVKLGLSPTWFYLIIPFWKIKLMESVKISYKWK